MSQYADLCARLAKVHNYAPQCRCPDCMTIIEAGEAITQLEREIANLKASVSAHDAAMKLQNGLGIDMHAVMLESGRDLAEQALKAEAERDAALKRVEELEVARGMNMLDRARSEAFPVIAKECDELRTRCEALEAAMQGVYSHLYAAKRQRSPSDDKIIADHIDCACDVAFEAIAAREV